MINTQLKSKCESQIASLVSEGLRLLTQEGRKSQGPCPEQNYKNTKLWNKIQFPAKADVPCPGQSLYCERMKHWNLEWVYVGDMSKTLENAGSPEPF